MATNDEFFTPEEVDEQIASLSRSADQRQETDRQEKRVIEDLQLFYTKTPENHTRAIERAWEHIVEKYQTAKRTSPETGRLISIQAYQEEQHTLPSKPASRKRHTFVQQLGILAAVLFVGLLVGGMLLAINPNRPSTVTGSRPSPTAPKTTASAATPSYPPGRTLSTSTSDPNGFYNLAWSPDSQRVAAGALDGVQIWDATTGKQRVNVPVTPDSGNGEVYVYGLSWSPNSRLLAIAARDHLLIADGQTGAIIHSYGMNGPTASVTRSTSSPYLSARMPASGSQGFLSVAWSPDGRFLAVSLLTGSDTIEILNAQTGAHVFDLAGNSSTSNYIIGDLTWSSDGQYVAGSAIGGLGAVDQNGPSVWAWNVSTHHMVFQHVAFWESDSITVTWQPGSHNLAFLPIDTRTQQVPGLAVWNVVANKQVKLYAVNSSTPIGWSPNGQEIAYEGTVGTGKNAVSGTIIMDASSGKQIYAYTGNTSHASVLAWSPNSKYIATGEGNTQGNQVVKVWVA